MADFYGCLIASSFRLKDEAAWLEDPDVKRLIEHAKSRGGFCEGSTTDLRGKPRTDSEAETPVRRWAFGWDDQYPGFSLPRPCPDCNPDDDTIGGAAGCETCGGDGELTEPDVTDVVQRHIHDEDCCVIAISGQEKLRYNGGTKAFVTARGTVYIDGGVGWDDVYDAEAVKLTLRDWAAKAEAL